MNDPELKEELLRTTARLFQEKGYAAVSLRSIASEVGVTTGSLYYYFSDKEEIVHEILDTGHRRVHEQVVQAINDLGPMATQTAKIRAGVRAHISALFEPRGFPAANIRIYAHVPEHLRAAVRPGRRAYERFWIELLASGPLPTSYIPAHRMAMFLFGAANWTFEWHRGGQESLNKLSDDLSSLIVGGTVLE